MKKKMDYSLKLGTIIGLAGATIISTYVIFDVFASSSNSSTSGIAILFLPIVIPIILLLAFAGFFIFGYCVGNIEKWRKKFPRKLNFSIIISSIIVIFIAGFFTRQVILMSLTSQIYNTHSSEFLAKKFSDSYFKNNKYVLGAIAQNSATSSEILDKIARLNDPKLHHKMGSIVPLLGANKKGLAVMRLVIFNPNTKRETIEYLAATSQNEYVLADIAQISDSAQILIKLEEKKIHMIDWFLASNPNTPSDVFLKLLERKVYVTYNTTLKRLINNPAASQEIKNKASARLANYSNEISAY